MIFIILFAALIAAASSGPTKYNRFIRDNSDQAQVVAHCSYKGYDPYFSTGAQTRMNHVIASLQLDTIDTAFTSAEMAQVYGVSGSLQEAAGAAQEFMDRYRDKSMKKLKNIAKAVVKPGLKHLSNAISILSPVLGIIITSMEAATAVKTPTFEDILSETTKALRKITDDVDIKMEVAMRNAAEDKVMLEKDFYARRYAFLFTYWAECSRLMIAKDIDACQREAYRLIVSSIEEFMLFREHLIPGTATFDNLDNDKRRRIEVNMVSFRNYAWLALLSLKTLAETYDMERLKEKSKDKDSVGNVFETCSEMKRAEMQKREEARTKKDPSIIENYTPPLKLHFYCMYKEELVSKARYFERYGYGAVEEILKVAKMRTEFHPDPDTTDYSFKYEKKWKTSYATGGGSRYVDDRNYYNYEVSTTTCKARLHHQKKESEACTYTIEMMETPYVEGYYETSERNEKHEINEIAEWKKLILAKRQDVKGNWKLTGDKGDWSGQTTSAEACRKMLENRQKEYRKQEQPDVKRYWSQEVLKVLVCGRLLAEKTTEECTEETMKKHIPEAYEQPISIEVTQGDGLKNPENAVDGLLSTSTTKPDSWKTNPSWQAKLNEKAKISKIEIYIDGPTGSYDFATASMQVVGGNLLKAKSYRRSDGYFMFYAKDPASNWGDYYRRVILTSNRGEQIKYGYLQKSEFKNAPEWFTEEDKWRYYKGGNANIRNFKGGYLGRFENLKVEVGTKLGMDNGRSKISWWLCKQLTGLNTAGKLPAMGTPLTVKCDPNVDGREEYVDYIRLTVNDDRTKLLFLAEVKVIGLPKEDVKNTDPEVMVISFKGATQSSDAAGSPEGSPDMATDTLLSTWSSTGEEDKPNWWKGELNRETVIRNVKVDLYGKYKSVTVEVSKDESQWTKCGDDGKDVDGDNVIVGFSRECKESEDAVKFVKITAENDNENGKSVLKIREVVVFGPYEDSDETDAEANKILNIKEEDNQEDQGGPEDSKKG